MKKLVLVLAVGLAAMVLGCVGEESAGGSGSTSTSAIGTGGSGSSTSTTGAGGEGGAPVIDQRPCVGMAAGAICGGSATAAIHGECNASGTCVWDDWTCAHGEIGDTCTGGRCARTVTVGENAECCTGCVATSGYCDHTLGQWGGNACQ